MIKGTDIAIIGHVNHTRTTLMAMEIIASQANNSLGVVEYESTEQSVLEERMTIPNKSYELTNPYAGLKTCVHYEPTTGQENRRERRKKELKNKLKR
jgi:hypothetical protein